MIKRLLTAALTVIMLGGAMAMAGSAPRKTRAGGASSAVTTVCTGPNGEWIKRGKSGIIVARDSAGVVRAMSPAAGSEAMGRKYADALKLYADSLKADGVRVYSLLAPSQGNYYMPDTIGCRGNEQRIILGTARMLRPDVTPVLVDSIFSRHLDEEIYSRTDHHWAPLGAYYAGEALARAAGVPFRPLSAYTTDTIPDYVGTMRMFSGINELANYPENFVFYRPPEGYKSEFTVYKVANNKFVSEAEPREEEFFKEVKVPGAAYIAFMGGDYRAAKITDTGGPKGRKLLIVKDSYGNAMVPTLFGSFEEVHVADFRYFPHNLLEYVRRNGITDLVFVNALSIGISPNAAKRFLKMLYEQK